MKDIKPITILEAEKLASTERIDKENFSLHKGYIIRLINRKIIENYDRLNNGEWVETHIWLPPDTAICDEIEKEFLKNKIVVGLFYSFSIHISIAFEEHIDRINAKRKEEYNLFARMHGLDKLGQERPKKKWFQKILS